MPDKKNKKQNLFPYSAGFTLLACLLLAVFAVNAIVNNVDSIARYSAMMLVGRLEPGDLSTSSAEETGLPGEPDDTSSQADDMEREDSRSAESPREVTNEPESSEPPKSGKKNTKLAKVLEKTYGRSGLNYGNISVKNLNKNYTIDIKTELRRKPDIKITKSNKPQVLIVHTHTSEAYADRYTGYYESRFQPRNQDNDNNIVKIGSIVADALEKAGIGVVHDTTYHDYPEYNGAYSRAAETIRSNLKKYPTIQVVLDIHRDAIIQTNKTRIKPTAVIGGKKAAQIMIISGCDDEGRLGFKDWELNMRFAVRLQKSMADTYPTLARPINFAPRQYNMHLTHGSLLVEFGTDVNTMEEACYSAQLFSECLVATLEKLK